MTGKIYMAIDACINAVYFKMSNGGRPAVMLILRYMDGVLVIQLVEAMGHP